MMKFKQVKLGLKKKTKWKEQPWGKRLEIDTVSI